jgi:cytochrome c biogenesis factor
LSRKKRERLMLEVSINTGKDYYSSLFIFLLFLLLFLVLLCLITCSSNDAVNIINTEILCDVLQELIILEKIFEFLLLIRRILHCRGCRL